MLMLEMKELLVLGAKGKPVLNAKKTKAHKIGMRCNVVTLIYNDNIITQEERRYK